MDNLCAVGNILDDAGYEVWLGNYRGNTYSMNHCSLDPASMEFWDFRYKYKYQHKSSDVISSTASYRYRGLLSPCTNAEKRQFF